MGGVPVFQYLSGSALPPSSCSIVWTDAGRVFCEARGRLLRPPQRPQELPARELDQHRVAPAAADQFGKEIRVARCRPPGPAAMHDRVAEEIGADADVVDPRNVAHVLDVVGHVRDRRLRLRVKYRVLL